MREQCVSHLRNNVFHRYETNVLNSTPLIIPQETLSLHDFSEIALKTDNNNK